MDRARRKAGHGRGHRRVGRALRPGRWSPLPRDHRLPALLRRGPRLGRRLQDLGGRTRHLGAIALGAVGAWIGCRLRGIPLPAWADALAPGIALAQACGRWGNWFNQELYGRATDLPWAVEITAGPNRDAGTYHPTFLYESLWCIGVALLVIWADRRFTLGHGRAFALYVAAYCVGRGWIEYMRVDEAHHILGLRLNVWTSIVVFVLAVVYLVLSAKLRPGREAVVEPDRDAPGGKDGGKDGDKAAPAEADAGAAAAAADEQKPEPAESKAPVLTKSDPADAKAPVLTKDDPAKAEADAPEAGKR